MSFASFHPNGNAVLTASDGGMIRLWDITVDDRTPIDEQILEFEVRSATTLGSDGGVQVLSVRDWEDKRQELALLRGAKR